MGCVSPCALYVRLSTLRSTSSYTGVRDMIGGVDEVATVHDHTLLGCRCVVIVDSKGRFSVCTFFFCFAHSIAHVWVIRKARVAQINQQERLSPRASCTVHFGQTRADASIERLSYFVSTTVMHAHHVGERTARSLEHLANGSLWWNTCSRT